MKFVFREYYTGITYTVESSEKAGEQISHLLATGFKEYQTPGPRRFYRNNEDGSMDLIRMMRVAN